MKIFVCYVGLPDMPMYAFCLPKKFSQVTRKLCLFVGCHHYSIKESGQRQALLQAHLVIYVCVCLFRIPNVVRICASNIIIKGSSEQQQRVTARGEQRDVHIFCRSFYHNLIHSHGCQMAIICIVLADPLKVNERYNETKYEITVSLLYKIY